MCLGIISDNESIQIKIKNVKTLPTFVYHLSRIKVMRGAVVEWLDRLGYGAEKSP